MASIGSVVIYSGQKWINQVYGVQPVWGIKNPQKEDEVRNSPENKGVRKNFEEMLKEEIKKQK